jgi:hypothetical protein
LLRAQARLPRSRCRAVDAMHQPRAQARTPRDGPHPGSGPSCRRLCRGRGPAFRRAGRAARLASCRATTLPMVRRGCARRPQCLPADPQVRSNSLGSRSRTGRFLCRQRRALAAGGRIELLRCVHSIQHDAGRIHARLQRRDRLQGARQAGRPHRHLARLDRRAGRGAAGCARCRQGEGCRGTAEDLAGDAGRGRRVAGEPGRARGGAASERRGPASSGSAQWHRPRCSGAAGRHRRNTGRCSRRWTRRCECRWTCQPTKPMRWASR